MVSKDDLKLFISEADDYTQKIEDSIFKLEKDPSNKDSVQNMFFAFHSLKGMTAMIGLNNLSQFCHHFESFLQKNKESAATGQKKENFINLLFEGLDVLRAMMKRVKENDITDLDEQFLSEIAENFEEFESDYNITFITPIPPDELQSVAEDKDNSFYSIYIKIQQSCIFKKVRLYIIFRALNEIGQICYSKPEPELLENGQFDLDFEIYLVSKNKSTSIKTALGEILEIETFNITEMEADKFLKKVSDFSIRWQKGELLAIEPEFEKEVILTDYYGPIEDETAEIEKMDRGIKIASTKVDIDVLEQLMNNFGQLVILRNKLNQIFKEERITRASGIFTNMNKLFLEIQRVIFKLKLVKVATTFNQYKRMVRDLALEQGKKVRLVLEGLNVEIDRKILEEINSPLIHLIRNAIYHGIETPEERASKNKDPVALLRLRTFRQAGSIHIEVEDDGKGVDYDVVKEKLVDDEIYTPEEVDNLSEEELLKHIFTPGFSTLPEADTVSGRGMGLAIVKEKILDLSGSFDVVSNLGQGAKFTLKVPFTRAILKAQLVEVGGDLFGIPIENVIQIFMFKQESVEIINDKDYYRIESKLVPIIYLDRHFKLSNGSNKFAVWCKKDEFNSAVFIVDELKEQMDVVVKPFKSNFDYYSDILASTITAEGTICLILDVLGLITSKLSEYKMLPIDGA